jgi:hypothetical protein
LDKTLAVNNACLTFSTSVMPLGPEFTDAAELPVPDDPTVSAMAARDSIDPAVLVLATHAMPIPNATKAMPKPVT